MKHLIPKMPVQFTFSSKQCVGTVQLHGTTSMNSIRTTEMLNLLYYARIGKSNLKQ